MTEDEAKTKWCPMTRFHKGADNDVYCNKPRGVVKSPHSTFCIASDCMVWVKDGWSTLNECETGYCGLTGAKYG